ncbi:MAG: hypothetical protein AAF465_00075 [Pseudomonadota bacterium]
MQRASLLLLLFLTLASNSQASDLKPGDGDALVRAHCSGCHSLLLVTTQRGDRAFWLKTIRWMQATQNLWPIPPEQEKQILDYLEAQYKEEDWSRRPLLDPELRPPLPKPTQ